MQCVFAVLYCNVWSTWLYNIFLHYLRDGTIFGKKVIAHNMYFIFAATSVRNISHLRRIQRVATISVRRSSYKVPVIFVRF